MLFVDVVDVQQHRQSKYVGMYKNELGRLPKYLIIYSIVWNYYEKSGSRDTISLKNKFIEENFTRRVSIFFLAT